MIHNTNLKMMAIQNKQSDPSCTDIDSRHRFSNTRSPDLLEVYRNIRTLLRYVLRIDWLLIQWQYDIEKVTTYPSCEKRFVILKTLQIFFQIHTQVLISV